MYELVQAHLLSLNTHIKKLCTVRSYDTLLEHKGQEITRKIAKALATAAPAVGQGVVVVV